MKNIEDYVDSEVVNYSVSIERNKPIEGERERALLMALFLDAKNHYAAALHSLAKRKNGRKFRGERVKKEIDSWMSGAPARIPFVYLCEHIGVDPDVARRAIRMGSGRHQVAPVRRRGW